MAAVGGIGVEVKPVALLIEEEKQEVLFLEESEKEESISYSGLASYIINSFHENRNNKTNSGIEKEIIESLEQFNGEYSSADKAIIAQEGGSKIFMNLTATKARAAKSWIADIYQSAKGHTWELDNTPIPDVPQEISSMIEEAIQREFTQTVSKDSPIGTPMSTEQAQETIRETNQTKRDIRDAIITELSKEASFQMKKMERKVRDQLAESKWDKSLLDFIDDFVVYPTAILKAPVITKQKSLKWKNGKPTPIDEYFFLNKRVDPLDIYPSAGATEISDGNLIEHLRFTDKSEVNNFKGLPNYKDEAIDRVLESITTGNEWFHSGIEQDKEEQERRNNPDYIHGLHFFGTVLSDDLKTWDQDAFPDIEDGEYVEVEAILIDSEVIKCAINDDPLRRRPYHKASFINRPGSWWGRSLPMLMKDIQRMCNAAARALANNMGVASGPQIEMVVDRLADDGPIESIRPFQIRQTKSDPTGSGGRAIHWHQPTSNAGELLKVYQEFEVRADDITGIPRWAYGNEKLAGAGTTFSGLAMLLESTSKIIKDAIRNIDEGLIKPRVEYQFYYNLIKDPIPDFSGDIKVIPIGSTILTIKAFESLRRNEFLNITANQTDQGIMGTEGRAEILRIMAKDLGLPGDVIPTQYEIKQRQKKIDEQRQQELQAKQQQEEIKTSKSLQATEIQINGQKEMAANAQQIQMIKAQMEAQFKEAELTLREQEQKIDLLKAQLKAQVESERTESDNITKKDLQNREIALKMVSPDHKGI